MRTNCHSRRPCGYALLVIVMMMTIALIALTAIAPYFVTQIKREREEEMIHRGNAYKRAIKLFFKRFGRYPVSLQELQNTQNIHFIRQLYKDPMSEDGEWRLIHLGEAKYPPKGFGFSNIPGAQSIGSPIGAPLGAGPAGVSPAGGLGSPLGGQLGSNQPSTGGMTPAEQISKPLGGGPTMGAPIVGVASKNTSESIHEVNERKQYNEWEFVYDPRYDIAAQMPIVPGQIPGLGQPGGQPKPGGPGGGPVRH